MSYRAISLILFSLIVFFSDVMYAQNIYELRKIKEADWLEMSTEERLNALSMANKHAQNQTFVGDFGQFHDLYKKWGYDFYEMEDHYENYAFRGFESYNVIEERRRRWSYNEFGDRITKMTTSGRIWNETYRDNGLSTVGFPSGFINSVDWRQVDGVWVAREDTNDWSFSAIGAGAIRTKFTPLTLSLPNINGMRLDFQSANNNLTVVNTAYMSPYTFGGVMLRGGHFRRKLGALTVGATYVNQYGVLGNREGGDSWDGTLGTYTPTPIMVAVRFLDDSPVDGEGGPIIYDVRLKVNGRYAGHIIPTIIQDDITRDRTTAVTNALFLEYLVPKTPIGNGPPKNDQLEMWESIPKYADYLYYNEYITGIDSKNVQKNFNIDLAQQYYTLKDPGGGSITVNGTESIVYLFDLTSIKEHVNRVEVEIEVGNDYRIQTAMIYTRSAGGGHDTSGKINSWYNATYWKTMAQADGNVKDRSNTQRFTIDFGLQVANIIYGVDFNFNYQGFEIAGEYVNNSSNYMFPDDVPGTGLPGAVIEGLRPRTGHIFSQLDNAYYVTIENDWEKFGFAGEIFKMGKFYRPYMDYFWGVQGGSYGQINNRNYIARVPLIEDNDDDDMYPDVMIVQRSMGYQIRSTEDPDGIFPGNDADNDGIADNNKNNNRIPDYNEPFLMFDVDPDEFVFGNDFNNNTIPDFRENDMKYDTPYDLDRQGHHFMFRYTPAHSVNITIGSFRTHGVGLDNRTNDDYVKLNVNYNVFDIGNLYAEYRHEKIQDDIRDQYVQVSLQMKEEYLIQGISSSEGRFSNELYYDELEYKNSRVNRLFLNSRIRALPFITLENHVKFEKNRQIEGVMYDKTYQPGELLTSLAMVNKVILIKKLGNWTLSPGIKFRFYKKDRSDVARPGDYYTTRIPLIMLTYDISQKSNIMFGLQGIPNYEFEFKDNVQSENNFRQKNYVLQLQNRTEYFGYDIWATTGIKYNELEYIEAKRFFESYKMTSLFVQVNLGW